MWNVFFEFNMDTKKFTNSEVEESKADESTHCFVISFTVFWNLLLNVAAVLGEVRYKSVGS